MFKSGVKVYYKNVKCVYIRDMESNDESQIAFPGELGWDYIIVSNDELTPLKA